MVMAVLRCMKSFNTLNIQEILKQNIWHLETTIVDILNMYKIILIPTEIYILRIIYGQFPISTLYYYLHTTLWSFYHSSILHYSSIASTFFLSHESKI